MKPAVLLLSGGLDSATAGALLCGRFELHALSFRYGQRHAVEIAAARKVGRHLGIRDHRVVSIDLGAFGGSALTDRSIAVPRRRGIGRGIPATYVPARNTIFLAFAAALAETIGARDLVIGVNVLDSSGYPDCTPAFLAAFRKTLNAGTRAAAGGQKFRIHAPLVRLTKAEIIRAGVRAGVDYALTHSCYDPGRGGLACGACDACVLRRRGFRAAGVPDPTRYASVGRR
ncbi:MAG: 7-cyano-7-deazaguanine synthase QueC [Candidatus Brocadiae bacterium]|nr:7-cyano-7-deazaguanine synthase QueC [Candidatus Brocadiia bacterium]